MKKITNICLVLLFALATVFCLAACDSGSEQKVTYDVTVDTTNVSVDTSSIRVAVYALDGTLIKEESLTDGKASFQLNADSYVATLSGLDETVSFSSFLLTSNSRKATITVNNSTCDEFDETYSYVFSVILLNGDYELSELSAQICDLDLTCINRYFDNGNVVDGITNGGECSVEIFDREHQEIYNEIFTVDLNMRFYIVRL